VIASTRQHIYNTGQNVSLSAHIDMLYVYIYIYVCVYMCMFKMSGIFRSSILSWVRGSEHNKKKRGKEKTWERERKKIYV